MQLMWTKTAVDGSVRTATGEEKKESSDNGNFNSASSGS